MKQFHDLYRRILNEGYEHADRTGVGRISVYNVFLEFDVSKHLPIVTTQKIFTNTAIKEILWMLAGEFKIDRPGMELPIWKQWTLTEEGVMANRMLLRNICEKENGYFPGDSYLDEVEDYLKATQTGIVGLMYPQSWRMAPNNNKLSIRPHRTLEDLPTDLIKKYMAAASISSKDDLTDTDVLTLNKQYWKHYDQINEVFLNLKNRPYSSRHRVSAWIPEWLPDEDKDSQYNILNKRGSLTPCHSFFQFTVGKPDAVTGKKSLNLFLYQGSCDTPVGGPYNVVGYSTLLYIFAHLLDMTPGKFSWAIGDAHIYSNQVELVQEQLQRTPLETASTLTITGTHADPFDFSIDDFVISDYESYPHLKYPVAV